MPVICAKFFIAHARRLKTSLMQNAMHHTQKKCWLLVNGANICCHINPYFIMLFTLLPKFARIDVACRARSHAMRSTSHDRGAERCQLLA
jgi:hypothetical protein